jgi:hypothetical protein
MSALKQPSETSQTLIVAGAADQAMENSSVSERIVGESYAAAILSQEHDCLVVSEPAELKAGSAVWKMQVRRADGTVVTAYFSLALTGRYRRPEMNVTAGTLIGKEHVVRDPDTGVRRVKGTTFWIEPYWTWRIIPTVVPTSQLEYSWRTDGEADMSILLGHVESDMARMAPAFVERCVVSRIAESMDEIRSIPISYVINERADRVFGVFIDQASVEDQGQPAYTFRIGKVGKVERPVLSKLTGKLYDHLLENRSAMRAEMGNSVVQLGFEVPAKAGTSA